MRFEIKNKPDYASLHVTLGSGEQVVAETGSLMAMSGGVKLESNMKGGLLGAAKRALGGESIFLNTYTGSADGQRVDLAPSTPGDMVHVPLNGNAVMVQRGSYIACTPGITVDSKWGGAKTFFSGEGLFMLKCHGEGDLWISSYGAIHEQQVEGTYIVDTTHVVAFDESLTFTVRKVGGLKSFFLSAEGLVVEFKGQGRVWFQTRSAPALAGFLNPFRKLQPKSN
jgi:uncharacterized protein (TIGR00266 family)